jgi:hypothetical protein
MSTAIFLPLGTVHTTPTGETYVFSLINQDVFGWRKVNAVDDVIEVADVADVIGLMSADFVEDDADEEEYNDQRDCPLTDEMRNAITTAMAQFTQTKADDSPE